MIHVGNELKSLFEQVAVICSGEQNDPRYLNIHRNCVVATFDVSEDVISHTAIVGVGSGGSGHERDAAMRIDIHDDQQYVSTFACSSAAESDVDNNVSNLQKSVRSVD